MRVLVTGAGGFVGPAVVRALLAAGHGVDATVRAAAAPASLAALNATVHRLDLLDRDAVTGLVARIRPDGVIHLAAISRVAVAEADPSAAYATNVGATVGLLVALRAGAPEARLLVAGSGDAYGAVEPADLPIVEGQPLRPYTVYGATKAAAEVAVAQWRRAHGAHVVLARAFNHTGPGQDPGFVCAALARQLARIEAERQEPVVRAGNLDPVRDFSDVRDVADAYVALLERGRDGEAYNVCSGDGVSIAEIVAILRTHARVPVRVESKAALRRAQDAARIVGSHAKLTRETGWEPRVALAETLRDVLDDWRGRVASGA